MKGKALIGLTIIFLLILPSIIHAERQKIRVLSENANIRIKPVMVSEILKKPSKGTIFEVENKVGEWFEIRFLSSTGLVTTGYIHEMHVEILTVIPEIKMESPQKPYKPRKSASSKKKAVANIKISVQSSLYPAGYDYEYGFSYLGESFVVTDLTEANRAFGFDGGIGFYLTPNIEIMGNASYVMKNLSGTLSIDVPSPFRYNDSDYDEATTVPKIKETIFSFGINLHPLSRGFLRPYFGGGAIYITGTMELVNELYYTETLDYASESHEVEINNVDLVETNISKWGFFGGAGMNLVLSSNMFVFAEGRYILAKTEVPHPLLTEYVQDEVLEIDLGGLSFSFGLKLVF